MKTAVVVPNWNGEAWLKECLDSLMGQSAPLTLVVVDNGSTDSSRDILNNYDEKIVIIHREKNYGFTGGVNPGIDYALENDFDAVALFNNDAVADKDWLKNLQRELKDDTGIVTSCLQTFDRKFIDSTGDQMTVWGLPYPRGRHTPIANAPNEPEFIFGASGGASLYSIPMLKQIGNFDEDFFAYYEDVDISFRAQLAGWKVAYSPRAIAYHRIGQTSGKIKGFTVYHTFKNLPMVMMKNVPRGLRHIVYPRFIVAYVSFFFAALFRGEGWPAFKGFGKVLVLAPKKARERRDIQARKKVDTRYILSIMTHDLPENSNRLRKLRSIYWKISGRKTQS